MAYRCDQAVTGGAREAIRCKVSGTVCAHQKMCMMEGRIVLTDKAMTCPARDGCLPDHAGGDPSTPLRSAQDDNGKDAAVKMTAKVVNSAERSTTAKVTPAKKTKTGANAKAGSASEKTAKAAAKKTTASRKKA